MRGALRADVQQDPAPPTETSAIAVITARKLQRSNRPPLGRLRSTVDAVRTVVRGLRPPALDDLGLAPA